MGALPLFYTVPVLAEQPDEISESYFFDELPVVLSATRLAQPLADTPTAMTVIDKEIIKASGANSVPDLLRLVPGFTVGFYSGQRATASYHGLADQYARDMQVLIDGRSIYDPGYGGVSWPDMPIDLDNINRIEVTRGPNATAYGSNSYAGVINIITDSPADAYGAKLIATAGESAQRKVYGRYAEQIEDFGYMLSAAYEEGIGFDARADDYNYRWISFHGDKQLDPRNQLKFFLGFSRGNYEEGYSDVVQEVRQLDNRYQYQQISWVHEENDANRFSLQFYHNHFKIEDAYETPKLSEIILSSSLFQQFPDSLRLDLFALRLGATDYQDLLNRLDINDAPFLLAWSALESHRYDLEFEHTLKPNESFRLVWGLGLRRDQAQGLQIFHKSGAITRDQARLFANGERRASDDLLFNLGGMLEKFEGSSPLFSYRAGANYHLDHQNTLRVNSSRAYRMPTLFEQNVDFVIFIEEPLNDINTWIKTQVDLDPQKVDSLELGYFGNFLTGDFTIDVKIFKERHKNRIILFRDLDYPDPDRGVPDTTVIDNFNAFFQQGANGYSNNGNADVYGIELNSKFKPTHKDLIFLGYSYMRTKGKDIREIENGIVTYDDRVNSRVPSHTFSMLGSHQFNRGFQLSLTYYFTDDMTWYGEGNPLPSYNRWDARIAKSFSLYKSDAEVSLLLQSLNGDNYDFYNNSQYTNIQERTAYLQFALEF
ncbi:MAG: TonB-dependent receptor [Candidatus Thiodiazotropha sp.]